MRQLSQRNLRAVAKIATGAIVGTSAIGIFILGVQLAKENPLGHVVHMMLAGELICWALIGIVCGAFLIGKGIDEADV